MVAPAHVRVIWSGVFGSVASPVEQWQFGIAVTDSAPALLEADLTTIAEAGVTQWASISGGMPAAVRLQNVRAVAVAETGLTDRDPFGKYLQVDEPVDLPGTGGTSLLHPTQVSLAHTLETGYPGALGRGRFFLPGPTAGSLNTDGRITTTVRDGFATRAVALINGMNSAMASLNGSPRMAVASGGSVTKGVAGAVRPITAVRVGQRLDIQRRRANEIEESYATLAVA